MSNLVNSVLGGWKGSQDKFMASLTNEQVWNWHDTHNCMGLTCLVCEKYSKRFLVEEDPQSFDAEPVAVMEEEDNA